MPKFTLICDHSCDLDTHVVTHQFNADYLPDVIMNIDTFLRGSGFMYDGELCIDEPVSYDAGTNLQSGDQHSDFYFDINRNR